MKGINKWSYAPYRPFLYEVGDIYICRIAPEETSVHFEWLCDGEGVYSVYYRKCGGEAFVKAGETTLGSYDIIDLDTETDYEFYVARGEKKSRIRLARTGKPIGVTVNYLHPDDDAYAYSGKYLCSPSMVRHPDGYLLASMDLFQGDAPQNLSLVFRSDDDGETWHYLCEIFPCFWGKLFIHKGDVYMLACQTEYGDLLLGRSPDGGKTFDAPVTLLRGTGKGKEAGIHKNPQNIVHYGGRIWETLEWGSWGRGSHAAMVMSCDENADIMNPENWSFSEPVEYDESWEGVASGHSAGNLEGTLVVFPNGKLYNVMRYCMYNTTPNYGLVLAYEVNTDDPDAPLKYSHAIKFPANHSKFMIKKDEKTGLYYTLASRILSPELNVSRNLLSLMASEDMAEWKVVSDIIDRRDEDPEYTGFQYVDFEIEGDDIIALIRTAINNPHNYHDANYSTFYRIKNFREL